MGIVEIPKWLKELPLAPEFRPTDTEFADPIAYISKIEKEASAFGICKIIPPLPKPSKKYVLSNLNKSLVKCPELGGDVVSKVSCLPKVASADSSGGGDARAVFTTRQQELGQENKKMKVGSDIPHVAVQKQVWQSGEVYTLEQFEAKAKTFSRSVLGVTKEVSPLVIESLFWKATSEKPIYIEYANDVPGSAFGEPESQFKYLCRSRRMRGRTSYKRKESSGSKNNLVGAAKVQTVKDMKDIPAESDPNARREMSKSSSIVNLTSKANFPESKNATAISSMEGSAGWKLSNSPWNLQVIARSPGSLTRFMPDDIPGVTSPMVYIGMLFSWFAWHVEDHELHSMNFLHTGSPKTWYAVPGDYAFDFEELIRAEAYGGKIDRLAVLSLLGEKTTLVSPDLIIASGIPCCRLIQYPGEFVVTFPRAYHVGFSHGFNCGEAANFGTPQWLKVAKEAAVRRAAMNYLPMLSHQQLLYLLTMSFVSRVPRSLLPGARSSRLRDRLREERELLVKKAFVEDMLHQNKLLSVLLGRQLKYRAVLWHPDSLPCMGKDSELLNQVEAISSIQQEEAFKSDLENNSDHNSLLDEMSTYMEQLNGLYLNDVDDDISCDFQTDSGTLACVACGILGYPFLAVVQPCGRASMDIVPSSDISSHGEGDSCHRDSHLPSGECCVNTVPEGHADALLPRDSPLFSQGWNISVKFLRPRVFCLEHAVQIADVLKTKGGVHLMVICHSDYQKIKVHASAVAEEIGCPFNWKDHTLNPASQEDLISINFAIDDEDDYGEDWTTKLGFNLRYCVKVRKTTFKQVRHALPLEGLFHYKSCDTNFDLKWQSRRHRSKMKLHYPRNFEHCTNVDFEINPESSRMDGGITRKKQKLIQYSRRKKAKPSDSTGASMVQDHRKIQSMALEDSRNEVLCDHRRNALNKGRSPELGKSKSDCLAEGVTDLKDEVQIIERSRFACSDSSLLRAADGFSSNLSLECSARRNSIEQVLSSVTAIDQTAEDQAGHCLAIENPEVLNEFGPLIPDNEVQLTETQTKCEIQDVLSCSTVLKGGDSLTVVPREGCSKVATDFCSEEVHNDVAFFAVTTPIYQTKAVGEDEVISDSDLKIVKGPTSPLWEASSAVPKESVPEHKLSASAAGDIDDSMREVNEESSSRCVDLPTTAPVEESRGIQLEMTNLKRNDGSESSLQHKVRKGVKSAMTSYMKNGRKRMRQGEQEVEQKINGGWFIRSPCEGLRPRVRREEASNTITKTAEEKSINSDLKLNSFSSQTKKAVRKRSHRCDIDGCSMSFRTKEELKLHKRNQCPLEDCGKKFSSHKYAVLHQRVHDDDRPLKCPWEGCTMSFKWAWARTEHIRLHTGERPYKCQVEGCGLSFRFVSDFSRHRRKMGHYVNLQPGSSHLS